MRLPAAAISLAPCVPCSQCSGTVRLIAGTFVFDMRPYLTSGYRRVGYHTINIVFAYLPIVYALAASRRRWLVHSVDIDIHHNLRVTIASVTTSAQLPITVLWLDGSGSNPHDSSMMFFSLV